MGESDSIIEFDYSAWIKDTRTISLAAKGAWIDILAAMWNTQNRGILSLSWIGYSRLIGATVDQTKAVITELVDHDVCAVMIDGDVVNFNCNGSVTLLSRKCNLNVTLINRRMYNKTKKREINKLRVKVHREKGGCNGSVTPLSRKCNAKVIAKKEKERKYPPHTPPKRKKNKKNTSSSKPPSEKSYQAKSGRYLRGLMLDWFLKFWSRFDYKSGKAEAADAWLDVPGMDAELAARIIHAAAVEAGLRQKYIKDGQTPKMAQGWLSGRRHEDEIYFQEPKKVSQNFKKSGVDLLSEGYLILEKAGEKAFMKFVGDNDIQPSDVESIKARAKRMRGSK